MFTVVIEHFTLITFILSLFFIYRRLLEKQERLEATVAALQEQHGEEAAAEAVAELQEMVTPTDREQLDKLKQTLVK